LNKFRTISAQFLGGNWFASAPQFPSALQKFIEALFNRRHGLDLRQGLALHPKSPAVKHCSRFVDFTEPALLSLLDMAGCHYFAQIDLFE
jgi:hypothetical protein